LGIESWTTLGAFSDHLDGRMSSQAPVVVVTKRLPPTELAEFIGHPFPDMVKFVVDLRSRVMALGGGVHADSEEILLDRGSRQSDLWGGNYYPGLGEEECVEFQSLISIRPAANNPSMEVQSPAIREKMREVVFALIGGGEPLP
jgi:hypothetical protein